MPVNLTWIKPFRHDADEFIVFAVAFQFTFDRDGAAGFQIVIAFQRGRNDGTRLVHQLNTNSQRAEQFATAGSGGSIVAVKLFLDFFPGE